MRTRDECDETTLNQEGLKKMKAEMEKTTQGKE